MLGSKDENDVQGYAGIPTDVNSLTFDANFDVGAAGVQFPRLQRFYVSVDSRADPFTNKPQKGQYLLNAWIDDLTPPAVRILTTRITAGRPLIVAQAVDLQSGVDPLSLVIGYSGALVGASAYDPESGIVVFGIPTAAPAFRPGKTRLIFQASDYQETKNINTVGDAIYPNTAFKQLASDGRERADGDLDRAARARRARSRTTGSSSSLAPRRRSSRSRSPTTASRVGVDKTGPDGIYSIAWKTGSLKKGKHKLLATVEDASGRKAAAGRVVKVCK